LLHQDDPQTHTLKHTYCFGNEFLVAPVIKPTASRAVTERVVYLPDGTWFDFWTQQPHSGGQEAVWRSADQQQFPLFVRAGAIIPMLLSVPDTLCTEDYVNNAATVCADDDLHFLIYPQGDSSFTVHDDTVVSCRDDP
jgi:alpha-D-xyloside xylohydrolase